MNVKSIDKYRKRPAQLLRDVDQEFPNASTVVVLVLEGKGDKTAGFVRMSAINTMQASFLRQLLDCAINNTMNKQSFK